MSDTIPTGIEALVCGDIAARQALGVKKYGQTVADNPLPLRAWLQHGYEEALDLAVYLRRSIAEIDAKGDTMPVATACLALAAQQVARRTGAAEAVSRLLDSQMEEIKRLREVVCEKHKVVQELAHALEFTRFACEHADPSSEKLLVAMSVGIRTLGRHAGQIDGFQRGEYWHRVHALGAKGGA